MFLVRPAFRGLALMAVGWLLARIVVSVTHSQPETSPEQIWRSMTPALKVLVISSFLVFQYGLLVLIRALFHRLKTVASPKRSKGTSGGM